MTDRAWRRVILAALLWFCVMGILYIRTKPGFDYDEAIDVLGSVSLLHSHEELKLPHDPGTWFCVAQHCFPLMSARYIGSVKEYLCIPLFAIFGPSAEVVRSLAMVLGALGILGVATFLARQVGYGVAAAAAWVLAVNPSYLDMTILDSSAFSPWMAAFGLLCFAMSGYLGNRVARNAFWVGAAAGFGVWARANYAWLLAALGAAIIIAAWRHLRAPVSHWATFAIGGVAGGAPFLAYQALSGGGTWQAVGMFPAAGTLAQRLSYRLWMMSETLLSDGEHHRVWAGPLSLPAWQLWLFPIIVAAACAICIAMKPVLPRVAALMLLIFAATLFCTSLPIGEHHIAPMLPIAASVVVLAGWEMRRYRAVLAAIAAVYAGSALYWQFATWNGLRTTGGVGPWSDGMYSLVDRLRADFAGREIKVLDWGLQNSIYVLSDAQVQSRELFWESTESHTDWNGPWIQEVRHGGVFLLNGPQNRQIPATTTGFLRALAEGRPKVRRTVIPQRSGVEFAEVVEIAPDTLGKGPAPLSDPMVPTFEEILASGRLEEAEGFHGLEKGGWRWTAREFSLTFLSLRPAVGFSMRVNVPEAVIDKLGTVRLGIRYGEHDLGVETFSEAGDYTVSRELDPSWGSKRFEFHLDKTLPVTPGDPRELGIIFVEARVELR